MLTPTSRTLKLLRDQGYLADVVEKWIPATKRRKDLFGFIDILAIREDEILGVQATSGANAAKRALKIANHENIGAVRQAGIRVVVIAWRKNTKNRWVHREIDCS